MRLHDIRVSARPNLCAVSSGSRSTTARRCVLSAAADWYAFSSSNSSTTRLTSVSFNYLRCCNSAISCSLSFSRASMTPARAPALRVRNISRTETRCQDRRRNTVLLGQDRDDLCFSESKASHSPSPTDGLNLSLAGIQGSRSRAILDQIKQR